MSPPTMARMTRLRSGRAFSRRIFGADETRAVRPGIGRRISVRGARERRVRLVSSCCDALSAGDSFSSAKLSSGASAPGRWLVGHSVSGHDVRVSPRGRRAGEAIRTGSVGGLLASWTLRGYPKVTILSRWRPGRTLSVAVAARSSAPGVDEKDVRGDFDRELERLVDAVHLHEDIALAEPEVTDAAGDDAGRHE